MINHHFRFNNDKFESVIVYDLIIGRDKMVQLGLTSDFKRQVLQWDGATVTMKETRNLIEKPYLNKREMCEVVIHTAEPAPTREYTERLVKTLDSIYAK